MKKLPTSALLAGLLVFSYSLRAADEPAAADKPADNTAQNVRDRDNATPTPFQQGHNKSDREISRSVRKAVVADKSLSTNAHNIKIITRDGKTTLRGPVNSQAEHDAIKEIALRVVSIANLDDQLEIKEPTAANNP